jgi:hypothetical protein
MRCISIIILYSLFFSLSYNLQARDSVSDYITSYLNTEKGGLNPSDPNFQVLPTDNFSFSFGYAKTESYGDRLLFSVGKNLSSESRGLLGYYTFETGNLLSIVGLDYIKKIFWNDIAQVGAKGHFSLNHFQFIDGNSLNMLGANILIGKKRDKFMSFLGYRTPVIVLYSADDADLTGEIVTGKSYIGVTYQLKPNLGLYADYSRKSVSLGVTISSIVMKYLPNEGEYEIGHPFMYY